MDITAKMNITDALVWIVSILHMCNAWICGTAFGGNTVLGVLDLNSIAMIVSIN